MVLSQSAFRIYKCCVIKLVSTTWNKQCEHLSTAYEQTCIFTRVNACLFVEHFFTIANNSLFCSMLFSLLLLLSMVSLLVLSILVCFGYYLVILF